MHHGGVGEHPILVVDDEPMVREVLSRYLAMEGFEVVTAADGEEALDRFAGSEPDARPARPDAARASTGYEVFRRMRARGAERP